MLTTLVRFAFRPCNGQSQGVSILLKKISEVIMNKLPTRPTTRRELVLDDFHGTTVADPYRWLEDDKSPEVTRWSDEQNAAFDAYIAKQPMREEIKSRLSKLWHFPRRSVPTYVSGKYFYWNNNGLQNQDVLYVTDDLSRDGTVVLDPNTLS